MLYPRSSMPYSLRRSSHEERGLKFDDIYFALDADRVAPRMRSVD